MACRNEAEAENCDWEIKDGKREGNRHFEFPVGGNGELGKRRFESGTQELWKRNRMQNSISLNGNSGNQESDRHGDEVVGLNHLVCDEQTSSPNPEAISRRGERERRPLADSISGSLVWFGMRSSIFGFLIWVESGTQELWKRNRMRNSISLNGELRKSGI
jgi:hypothetical protein